MHERLSIGSFSALEPFERVARQVREQGGTDPATADELARLYTWAKALDLLPRACARSLARGQDPGPGALVMKNAISDVMLRAADLGMRALGAGRARRGGRLPSRLPVRALDAHRRRHARRW